MKLTDLITIFEILNLLGLILLTFIIIGTNKDIDKLNKDIDEFKEKVKILENLKR